MMRSSMPATGPQAVILTAGMATRVAMASTGQPKALLRVGDVPVLVHQLRWLSGCGVRRTVIVHAPGDRRALESVVSSALTGLPMEISWTAQPQATGPGDALSCAGGDLDDGDTILLLADTYLAVDEPLIPTDSVATAPVGDPGEFCVAKVDAHDVVVELLDKSAEGAGLPALVGLYRFSDGAVLRRILAADRLTGELQEILDSYRSLVPLSAAAVSTWQDLGSYRSFVTAARSSVTGRSFHGFEIGAQGSLTKTGPIDLMEREASWFQSLATEARRVTPTLHDFDRSTGRLTLDLLDYPTLASVWLYEDHPPAAWTFVVDQVLDTMQDAFWASGVLDDPARVEAWCRDRYLHKTTSRLVRWPAFDALRRTPLRIDGTKVACFDELWEAAAPLIGELSASASRLVPTHGDLTFSNILLARRFGFVRLIDPTSSVTGGESWGDPRYDVAKLRQCYAGQYDKLASGLFECRLNGDELDLRIYGTTRTDLVTALDAVMVGRGFDLADVRLIAALQFLSMVPLHGDDPARQLAMYVTGLTSLAAELECR